MPFRALLTLRSPSRIWRTAQRVRQSEPCQLATPECRHVSAGHAIQALDRFFKFVQRKKAVLAFVRSQLDSPISIGGPGDRIYDPSVRAGFYTNHAGYWPWRWSNAPLNTYDIGEFD
jgi:hypothetical protein